MRIRSALAALALAVVALAAAAPTSAKSAGLPGTRWAVKVTPENDAAQKGEKAFDDVIVFDQDKVGMTECEKAGFVPSTYFARKSGEGWRFSTVQVSVKEGKSAWSGEAGGDAIHGTLVRTKSDGTVLRYRFEGKAAAALARK